ncbi:MAG: TRAP transporter large permease subunit [Halieaceae bacterium]|jgi:tripartite ATP-independent transporter DctM subunit
MIEGELALALFASVCILLLFGFPVALTLGGTALLFASFGVIAGHFDASFVAALSGRIFGTITNETLVAVPLFILMGVTLERAKIAEELLTAMANALGNRTGGLGMAVIIVGALLAASTGIVGATVVTMGVLALPSMLRAGYDPKLATGLICATGTLGQIIPPSIALVLLGDIMSTAYQQAQLQSGIINTQTVSVGDLFVGSLVPGVVLVGLYLSYLLFIGSRNPASCPPPKDDAAAADTNVIGAIIPPLALITIVLGSIILGAATPTEAAGVGAVGAMILATYKSALNTTVIKEIARSTMETTSMVFLILIGAALFSLVFRGFGGDEIIEAFFESLGGGPQVALLIVMLVMFLLGFILDFIEITFVVVPIVAPILLSMGFDPVWLGVMIAVNLQTSFLTPPFGFALFYLRGVADESVATSDIYRGVVPFVLIQLALLAALWLVPDIVTWLPSMMGR